MSVPAPQSTPLLLGYGPAQPALGLISFADAQHATGAALHIHPGLHCLTAAGPTLEHVLAQGPVRIGSNGPVRYASDGAHLLASIELRVDTHGGLEHCAELAYRSLREFNAHSGYAHVLRMWNYMDHINLGAGDAERYRRFCVGRARAFAEPGRTIYPAASALGRMQPNGLLQVYWLAARQAGLMLENPRQVSAWRYPRDYGPAAPGFARACLTPQGPLLISGTASIVGHASQHAGDLDAQLQETLNNIEALIAQARLHRASLPPKLAAGSLLKIYVRHAEHAPQIVEALHQRCGAGPQWLLLGAEICRRELLLEMDCVHGLGAMHLT